MQEDRRELPRARLFQFGYVVIELTSKIFTCVTHNVHERGAKIEVDEAIPLPDFFLLAPTEQEPPRPCQVLWRMGPRMGVVFTDVETR